MVYKKLILLVFAFSLASHYSGLLTLSSKSHAEILQYSDSDKAPSRFYFNHNGYNLEKDIRQVNTIASLSKPVSNFLNQEFNDEKTFFLKTQSKEKSLPISIQAIKQAENKSTLYVNGSEIITLYGNAAFSDSKLAVQKIYQEVSSKNLRFSQLKKIHAKKVKEKLTVQLDKTVLFLINQETMDAYDTMSPELLVFDAANRLRQALGVLPKKPKSFKPLAKEFANTERKKQNYQETSWLQKGYASWYGGVFHGRRAADGSIFNKFKMTAAHKSLPFGTMVKVTNEKNNRTCVVKITDRGPFVKGRIIDLSKQAAKKLGMLGSGVTKVSVRVLKKPGV